MAKASAPPPNGGNGPPAQPIDDTEEAAGGFVVVHAPSMSDAAGSRIHDADDDHHHRQPPLPHQPSLFRDPIVPPLARWGVPLLLLANDALLLYSNFGAGATVHVRVFDGESPDGQGRTLDSAPLYTITLGRAIRDMWNAKAYFTSVLIAVFAGAWPHIKSLASLLCWTLDGRRLGSNARRALMTLAYVLQKLSHVETFVLVILMTGGSLKAHLPGFDDWGIRSVIKPRNGFFCFLTGLCCSMFLSRIALHYDYIATAAHKEAREEREEATYAAAAADLLGGFSSSEEEDDDDELKEEEEEEAAGRSPSPWTDGPAAAKPRPQAESRGCGAALAHVVDTVGVPSGSRWQDVAVPYLLLGLLAFFCAGLATPCFAFAYEGLAGWILSHVTEHWPDVSPPVKESTVVSLGLGVPAATDAPDAFGTRYLQAAFLFFVVGAPLGCLALLLALTLLPVRVAGKLLTAAEVLYAWSAPDVLFVSMVTTTLEIQNFVNFVLGDRCDGLNAMLRVVFDKELDGDDVCFDMVASMESGVWIYGAASLIFFALAALILRNLQRAYAPYLAAERRKHRRRRQALQRKREERRRRRRRASGRGGIWELLFGWDGAQSSSSSSVRAATVPLLVEEGEEGKLEAPEVAVGTSPP